MFTNIAEEKQYITLWFMPTFNSNKLLEVYQFTLRLRGSISLVSTFCLMKKLLKFWVRLETLATFRSFSTKYSRVLTVFNSLIMAILMVS